MASLCVEVDLFVAQHARDRIFVHAGAVGWRGSGLILPGASGSGKSTLVAALVAAGATLLSDEFAVLDPHGRVHPYRRPEPEIGGLDGGPVAIEPAQAERSREPLPVGLVGALRFQPGARWNPRWLPRSRMVLELLAHTVSARSDPARALATLAATVRSSVGFRASRGEARPVAEALLELLEHAPGEMAEP